MIKYIKKLRNDYVINHVKAAVLPDFQKSPIMRKRMIFSGKVQNVGFRLEIFELAKRLGLNGWVMNREDKSVEAEIQGEEERIVFLVEFMKALKRARVDHVEIVELDVVDEDDEFRIVK